MYVIVIVTYIYRECILYVPVYVSITTTLTRSNALHELAQSRSTDRIYVFVQILYRSVLYNIYLYIYIIQEYIVCDLMSHIYINIHI